MTAPLGDLQAWLADALTAPVAPADSAVERTLTRGPQASACERLAIYRSGYRARLVECLADDYPAVRHLFGEDRFERLAEAYVEAHPSRSPSLNGFGRKMAAFVGAAGVGGSEFASDLARLEWALVEAIHAPPGDPLPPERLAAILPERWAQARLLVVPSVQVLRFDHMVDAYYQAFRDGRSAVAEAGASATLVHRRGWTVWRRDLTFPMARVLEAIVRGAPLGLALAASGGASAQDVSAWFRDWTAAGVFAGVRADG